MENNKCSFSADGIHNYKTRVKCILCNEEKPTNEESAPLVRRGSEMDRTKIDKAKRVQKELKEMPEPMEIKEALNQLVLAIETNTEGYNCCMDNNFFTIDAVEREHIESEMEIAKKLI